MVRILCTSYMWQRELFSRVGSIVVPKLTLSWQRSRLYRNQSTDLLCNSMIWLLYNRDLRHERINWLKWFETIVKIKCYWYMRFETSMTLIHKKNIWKNWTAKSGLFVFTNFMLYRLISNFRTLFQQFRFLLETSSHTPTISITLTYCMPLYVRTENVKLKWIFLILIIKNNCYWN